MKCTSQGLAHRPRVQHATALPSSVPEKFAEHLQRVEHRASRYTVPVTFYAHTGGVEKQGILVLPALMACWRPEGSIRILTTQGSDIQTDKVLRQDAHSSLVAQIARSRGVPVLSGAHIATFYFASGRA